MLPAESTSRALDVNSFGSALHARRIMARELVAEQCDIEKECLLLIKLKGESDNLRRKEWLAKNKHDVSS